MKENQFINKKKRIGIDARFWNSKNAGISQYTKSFIKKLIEEDECSDYFIFLRRDDLEEWDITANNFFPVVVEVAHYSFSEQFVFLWKLLHYRLDLVFFLNLNHPILYPKKFVIVIYDLAYLHFPPKRLKSKIYKLGYIFTAFMGAKRASKIITLTETVKKEIERHYNVDKKKIIVLPLVPLRKSFLQVAEESKSVDQLRKKFKITYPVIFYIGGWRPHKNISVLLDAFAKLQQKNVKTHLLIGGSFDSQILTTVQNHPNSENIILTGFIPEEKISHYYALADILVIPSLYEGFGLPILEAQYMEIPVVSSNIAVLQEVGRDSVLYFNPLDSTDLVGKIKQVLENKKIQYELIKKGRSNIERFNTKNIINQFMS